MRVNVLIAESSGVVAFDVAMAAYKKWVEKDCPPETRFIVTGNKIDPADGRTEARFYADYLKASGIPTEQIIFEANPSSKTWEQAVETKKFLDSLGLVPREVEVIVWTHDLHAARVAAHFRNNGIEPRVVAVRYQADRYASLSVFWMRLGRWGHGIFERYVAAVRDWRAGYITGAQFRRIREGKMPEGMTLEIVERS